MDDNLEQEEAKMTGVNLGVVMLRSHQWRRDLF